MAIKSFQQNHELSPTGEIDDDLLVKLELIPIEESGRMTMTAKEQKDTPFEESASMTTIAKEQKDTPWGKSKSEYHPPIYKRIWESVVNKIQNFGDGVKSIVFFIIDGVKSIVFSIIEIIFEIIVLIVIWGGILVYGIAALYALVVPFLDAGSGGGQL